MGKKHFLRHFILLYLLYYYYFTYFYFFRYIGLNEEFATEIPTPSNTVSPTTPSIPSSSSTSSIASPTPPTTTPMTPTSSSSQRSTTRNRGVIFPSVKNKPIPANSTFTTDVVVNIKDVRVSKKNI